MPFIKRQRCAPGRLRLCRLIFGHEETALIHLWQVYEALKCLFQDNKSRNGIPIDLDGLLLWIFGKYDIAGVRF